MKKENLWQNPLDKGLNPITMWSRDIIQEQNNKEDEQRRIIIRITFSRNLSV